ncbi:MAG: hypothetical protein AAB911_02180 [Patescibacteria group bacterium]
MFLPSPRSRRVMVIVGVGVIVMVILVFGVSKIQVVATMNVEKYMDDGKGLVYVGGHDQVSTFGNLQSWRNNHPDRFKRITSIAVSSYWLGAIVAYNPDTTAVARR